MLKTSLNNTHTPGPSPVSPLLHGHKRPSTDASGSLDHRVLQHFLRRLRICHRLVSGPGTKASFGSPQHGHTKPSTGTSGALDHRILQHFLRRLRICHRLVSGPSRKALFQLSATWPRKAVNGHQWSSRPSRSAAVLA